MARSEIHVDAPPERVFELLADPDAYERWVVGAKQIRSADPGFPGAGTSFEHTVGFGPVTISDTARVLDVDPPRRLVLEARARPLGTARVRLELAPEGAGTRVRLVEYAGDPLSRFVFNPLTHLLVRGRNERSLRRLKGLAEDAGRSRA